MSIEKDLDLISLLNIYLNFATSRIRKEKDSNERKKLFEELEIRLKEINDYIGNELKRINREAKKRESIGVIRNEKAL
ncbi:MAG: hypothetical protein AB1410_00085 [Acidobacteriota bacterium]